MKVPDCPVCLLFWIDREPVLVTYHTCSTRVKITKLCMPAEANKLQVKKKLMKQSRKMQQWFGPPVSVRWAAECCTNKLSYVVSSTGHQTFMGFTGSVRVALIGVMFKDMFREMETESTPGFPSEGTKRESSGYLIPFDWIRAIHFAFLSLSFTLLFAFGHCFSVDTTSCWIDVMAQGHFSRNCQEKVWFNLAAGYF